MVCGVGRGIAGIAGIEVFFFFWQVVGGGIWGSGCSRSVPNLKLEPRPPGETGGNGVSPVFQIRAATPIPKGGIGVATPKKPPDCFLGVTTCARPAEGVAATPKIRSQLLGVADPIYGGRIPSPLFNIVYS